MSAGSEVAVLVPPRRGLTRYGPISALGRDRPLVRLAAFAALALYGVLRWATLMHPAPIWRLVSLLCLSVLVLAAGAVLRGRVRIALPAIGAVALLAAFPIAGVPLSWVTHVRIAVTADGIGQGLSGLPGVLLPYLGINPWIRVVMVLGAALLLLGAALSVASPSGAASEARRAVAAVLLVALAIIPCTLIRPELPYLQGAVLFALVAAFLWGDRIGHGDLAAVTALAGLAAVVAMLAAPALDRHKPWLNYQALAANLAPSHPERFDWTQRYGPLHWPRDGREVFDVQASRPDYWKTENLEVFNGSAWTGQSPQSSSPQYTVAEAHLRRWTQTLRVTLRAMKTSDVIGAGVAGPPSHLLGAMEGFSDGTWADPSGLGPGDSYEITAYEPQPSPAQLQAAGTRYPGVLFPNYVSINIPSAEIPQAAGYAPGTQRPFTSVVFPPFGSRRAPSYSAIAGDPAAQLVRSPYARAYELALRLERRAATPYAYAMSVKNYLDSGSYKYNENPPRSRYPLATFLFSSKRGYCQQFAGTMALLLRMGGVPARVAVGFTPGTYNTATRSWVVTDTDAHAWTEAWFPSYGWVRFDPTPAAAPARGGHAPLPAIKGATVTAPRVRTPRGQSGGAAGIAAPAPHHGTGFPIAIVLAGVIGLALVGLAVASTVRLRGPTDEELLAELERAFIRCGREVQSGITLAGLEQRLRGSPEAQAYVRALRLCRFAGARELPSAAQRRALRSQLRAGLGITGLLRAMWALPPRLVLRLPGLRPSEGS